MKRPFCHLVRMAWISVKEDIFEELYDIKCKCYVALPQAKLGLEMRSQAQLGKEFQRERREGVAQVFNLRRRRLKPAATFY